MNDELRLRWERVRDRLAGGRPVDAPEARFEFIEKHYGDPRRAYHGLWHLTQCFLELDAVKDRFADPDLAELALWYHDLVYAPFSATNEQRSADVAGRVALALGLGDERAERVRRLVQLTRYHRDAPDEDARLFLDIDDSILGQDPETFARYQAEVREEYRRLPDWFYRRRRRAFLEDFQRRPSIYLSETFRAKYEARARANLAEAIAELDEPPATMHVHLEGDRVFTTVRGELRERCALGSLVKVVVMTTDAGPFACDVYFCLFTPTGGCIVPQEAVGATALLDRLYKLPGFDFMRFVESMGSTQNRNFVVWEHEGVEPNG